MRSVVITDATSNKAIVVARFLKDSYRDLRVITCDHRPLTKILHTRYSDRHVVVPDPAQDAQGYITALSALVRESNALMLVPVNSREIRLLVRNKDRFGMALSYYGDAAVFDVLDNKDQLQAFAAQLGVKVPRVYAGVQDVDGPVVVKPVNLSGAKNVRYYEGRHDVQTAPGFMIQQRIGGQGVGYSVFARDGKIMAAHGHIRLGEYPSSGGSSTYRDDFFVPAMREAAETLLGKTRWSGFAMLEFKWTGSELYLIEVNPRIWGSVYQGLANGTNYFESVLGAAATKIVPAKKYATYFSPLFYISLIGYFLRGDLTPLKIFWRNRARNAADVSLWRDPLGYLSMAVR